VVATVLKRGSDGILQGMLLPERTCRQRQASGTAQQNVKEIPAVWRRDHGPVYCEKASRLHPTGVGYTHVASVTGEHEWTHM
jgi:hypothetical protein